MTRTMRRLRKSRCGTDGCRMHAAGDVWPPKRTGEPQGASVRACAVHLNEAQDRGWTVSRDLHAALMGEVDRG